MHTNIQMSVPVGVFVVPAVNHLDEPDAPLSQAPRHKAHPADAFIGPAVEPVKLQRRVGFLRNIESLRSFSLHSESSLKSLDASRQRAVGVALFKMTLVEKV